MPANPMPSSPVKIQVRNAQNGNTQYRIGTEGTWNNLNSDQIFGIENVKSGDQVFVKATPNEGQELDTTGTSFWIDGQKQELGDTLISQ